MINCTDSYPGTASSCQTGESNTSLLVALNGSGSPAPYSAAEYCAGLNSYGHSDWYLPARDELYILYLNNAAIGNFDTSGVYPNGYYWSSSELNSMSARADNFADAASNTTDNKNVALKVRCVRRD
jgi:hypothetical protein